jgi:formamidopyrimidine-DNA glycosylase
MPELPDITNYVEALRTRTVGATLLGIRVFGPSWLRTVEPRLVEAGGRRVRGVRRLGKRIVFELDGDLFVVLHLMIAGRLRWRAPRKEPAAAAPASRHPKSELGALDFSTGTLVATEAGTRKRAALHLLRGEAALAEQDPGGLEPLDASRDAFTTRLRAGNHTVKRALTDPHIFSGIGNAYSDEILHAARLSPFKQTQKLTDDELDRLYVATRGTLTTWCERLRAETGDGFPDRVTAFRPEMAVHGRYREACPRCGAPVQRIAYADNEANYCAPCQTDGKVLADRALSRLLHGDWPKTLEEMEARRPAASGAAAPATSRRPRGSRSPRRAPE